MSATEQDGRTRSISKDSDYATSINRTAFLLRWIKDVAGRYEVEGQPSFLFVKTRMQDGEKPSLIAGIAPAEELAGIECPGKAGAGQV